MARNMLTENEKTTIRARATETLIALELDASRDPQASSWLNKALPASRSERCQYFDTEGFLHNPAFATDSECAAMKEQMRDLVESWDPSQALDSFGTDDKQNSKRGDYFLESADQVHHFVEPDSLDEDGLRLKPENQSDKLTALNKSGHALHLMPGAFHDYCISEKVRSLVTEMEWKDPVVPQSMYIFKQARTGGVVNSHQDSTFLFTTPRQSCLGLWLALDDATLDNGCLWVRPKSHNEATRRQYKRNTKYFGLESIQARSNECTGDSSEQKFLMETLHDNSTDWEGAVPANGWQGLLDEGFVPIECRTGDLLAFCGELDHLSLANQSSRPRHTFQLHLVEGPEADVIWSPFNWLQYPDGKTFLRLLDPSVTRL